ETGKREAQADSRLIRDEHNRALADLETGIRMVAELRSQLSQASAEQGRLAALVQEHEVARDHLIAEHHRALDDVETSRREALAELRAQLEQSSAEQKGLIARIQEHEGERDSVLAEHPQTVADMETGKHEALAELRSQP